MQGVEWNKACREEGGKGGAAVMELPRDGKAGRASDKRVRGKLLTYLRSSPSPPPIAYRGVRIASKTKNVKGVPKVLHGTALPRAGGSY